MADLGGLENILAALGEQPEIREPVFRTALELAQSHGARLWLFHFEEPAIGPPDLGAAEPPADQADWLGALTRRAEEAGVPVRLLVARNTGRQSIVCAIEESGAGLILLGRTDRSLFNDALVGLSSFVLHHSPASVNILFVGDPRRWRRE